MVAGRGYSSDFIRVDWRASQLVAGGRGWERKRSAQWCAFRHNASKVVASFLSGQRWTPRVFRPSVQGRRERGSRSLLA